MGKRGERKRCERQRENKWVNRKKGMKRETGNMEDVKWSRNEAHRAQTRLSPSQWAVTV